RQGLHQGRPVGRVRRALRGQVAGRGQAGAAGDRAVLVRDRRGRAAVGVRGHVRHQHQERPGAGGDHPRQLRPAPGRHRQGAGPVQAHLPPDRVLRALWPRHLHVGEAQGPQVL
ncbi:hypothetical protein IWW55_004940, partial [Coemansia sp. RSA 2706]